MRILKFMVVAIVAISAFVACNNEDESAELTLEQTSLYFSAWGDDAKVIKYVAKNAVQVAVANYSSGLYAEVDSATRTILVRPVGEVEEGEELENVGSVVVNALNAENEATSYYISVYITPTQVLDEAGRANCYVVTTPAISYSFDVMHRPDGESLTTSKVKLLWQSNSSIVKNVELTEGNAIFYVAASKDDPTRLEDTNAVIAACNSDDEVVWSWHIWIVNEDPLAESDTYSNGKVFMKKNLGAFCNSNGSADEQKIYDSYGMYYQWGRKDPFPRPFFFNAAGAEDEGRADGDGTFIAESREERSAENGTIAYVTQKPMVYITNAASAEVESDGVGDWLVAADNTLWRDADKSVYDPCPYGWKVPSAEDLQVLMLADTEDNTPLETARKQYGWHLSDGNNKFFYSACGRRRYNDGKVENMNYKDGVYPSQPEPWEGYYWTSTTTADGKAVSLYFDLTTTRTINKFFSSHSARRANGFQVRCVKE